MLRSLQRFAISPEILFKPNTPEILLEHLQIFFRSVSSRDTAGISPEILLYSIQISSGPLKIFCSKILEEALQRLCQNVFKDSTGISLDSLQTFCYFSLRHSTRISPQISSTFFQIIGQNLSKSSAEFIIFRYSASEILQEYFQRFCKNLSRDSGGISPDMQPEFPQKIYRIFPATM